jgi:hypothetical protein
VGDPRGFSRNAPRARRRRAHLAGRVREARERFLATHRRQVVRTTVYRTRCLLREIERGNWHLNMLPIDANGVPVHAAR